MRKISLCLTTYQRYDLLLKSFAQVLNDDRISEIVIVDDHSDANTVQALRHLHFSNGKVKIFYNDHNHGVYRNKKRSVELATNEWCIVFDSDNVITPAYLDTLYSIENWETKTAYLPSFGKPTFDWRHLAGTYTRSNIADHIRRPMMDSVINAMNFFVNRDRYLQVFDPKVEPISADSIYINYLLLLNGGTMEIVKGLEYEHLIHKGSHYVQNRGASNNMHGLIMNKLKQMR